MGIKKWSKTANSNDSISSSAGTINWKEGMPASAVNDSARVTMADVRDWYEDAQWVNLGDADGTTSPRRATNEISLSGTHTLTYHVGRRLKALDASGNLKYGTITGTTFSGGTQITLALDSGSLTGSVSQIWLSALTAVNPAAGQAQIRGLTTADTPGFSNIATVLAAGNFKLQMFTLTLTNTGSAIEHNIHAVGDSGNAAPSGNIDKITGATVTFNTTPTGADSSTAFVAGLKIGASNPAQVYFDTADQSLAANCLMFPTLVTNTTGTSGILVRANNSAVNINGSTIRRPTLNFSTTGGGFNINTTNITSGQALQVNVLAFIL